ncbi:DUF2637 domain-containing protein [Amycolatopsis japonica]|uniref:DUF2637 domain-containing protein n=1 Tax=Amycolatopsis japonica TaxID=208439 RepID=UPI0034030008
MTVTALSAAVSSFSGLQSLAAATGWPAVLAPLLPLTVDAYAMTSTRVWLSNRTRSAEARRFARWNAVVAIALSLVGNGVWHLVAARTIDLGWPIVVCVGAVPPAVLGLLSHLAVLRGQDGEDDMSSRRPDEDEHQNDRTAVDEDNLLLAAARAADAAHRTEHGKAITRDELRRVLHVSTERASVILRKLRETR